jgi:hypothetical protein
MLHGDGGEYISGKERGDRMTASPEFLTVRVQRRTASVVGAWLSGLIMLATATSVVGLFVAPLAVPTAVWVVTRRRTSWAMRVPLLIGAVALSLLAGAWLASGAGFGSTTGGGSSA